VRKKKLHNDLARKTSGKEEPGSMNAKAEPGALIHVKFL